MTGRDLADRANLVAVDHAEWSSIPRYDLRAFNDEGKGAALDHTAFRKDWLYRTLQRSNGLWLTNLLSDYTGGAIAEGETVFCHDVAVNDLAEGHVCIFRIDGAIYVARYSVRSSPGMTVADRIDEEIVTAGELGTGEGEFMPVARIVGRLIGRI
ncbi:hypothetical protein PQ455_10550 [Sphingomonas naphthae]|uniref:Uncharacterized protein n=1 Tax=Sphingomonas naphthae TaxID=1813468 RepID=A0ABY7THA8_9SPHN|nr:hypothetical protein [Sphingomonas naphthae]WCT72087.1 hypothetical protein PQ455_10550 [Sphingomonas naphthae]